MYQVLIVEDDPMVASIDQQYVEMGRDFRVARICKDGQEGLAYLKTHNVDLVILDYYTPAMTGQEFVDGLHSMGKTPAIIMVTSANDTSIIRELLSRGVLDYLVKPFQYASFRQALERFLQTRRLLGGDGRMDQDAIDQLVQSRNSSETSVPLAKGLNKTTLELIQKFFSEHTGQLFSSEQVAEEVGLSRITVRRYVGYLAENGQLQSIIDYQTGGRPSIRYQKAEG